MNLFITYFIVIAEGGNVSRQFWLGEEAIRTPWNHELGQLYGIIFTEKTIQAKIEIFDS